MTRLQWLPPTQRLSRYLSRKHGVTRQRHDEPRRVAINGGRKPEVEIFLFENSIVISSHGFAPRSLFQLSLVRRQKTKASETGKQCLYPVII